jgi:hypothetical protein
MRFSFIETFSKLVIFKKSVIVWCHLLSWARQGARFFFFPGKVIDVIANHHDYNETGESHATAQSKSSF